MYDLDRQYVALYICQELKHWPEKLNLLFSFADSDLVVTITVFKSIVRHHYSIVRPHSYLTCTCNDVFNCDARNYLLI